jgi:hypothetical protein
MPELSNNIEGKNPIEKISDWIIKEISTAYNQGKRDRDGELREKVEGMFLTFDEPPVGREREVDGHYNRALYDIQALLADDKPYKTCKYCGDEVIAPHDLDYHFSCEALADDPDDKAVLNDTLTGGDN